MNGRTLVSLTSIWFTVEAGQGLNGNNLILNQYQFYALKPQLDFIGREQDCD